MAFKPYAVEVTTTGGAGVATGVADTPPLHGALEAVEIDYEGAPATTTVDLDEVLSVGLGRKILDKAASNTDVTHTPRVLLQDNTGANLTAVYGRYVFAGRSVRVTVALSNQLSPAVRVRLIMEV
jgi:hypothetical protein